ncbi:hypothetical protein BaRGS_00040543 [Batillaria attramentaria]|uniref:MAM domain-containing protein n=1 Tax=Batillaria attramentaria TaxID=370345 RepID=A0ABD0IZP6_9CAEN
MITLIRRLSGAKLKIECLCFTDSYGSYALHLAPDTLTGTIGSDWLCSTQSHNRCLRFDYKMNNEQNTLRVYLTYENSATTKLLLSVTEEAPKWKTVIIPVTATERFKENYDNSYRCAIWLNIANITIMQWTRRDRPSPVDRDELAPSAVDPEESAPTDVNPEQSAPSATLLIVVATAVVAIVVIVAVLSVYAMKRKRSRRPAENADEHSEGAPLRHQFAPSRPGIPSLHSVHNCSDIEDVNVSENTGGHRNPRVASDGYLEPHPRMNSAPTRAQVNSITASGDIGNTDPGEASNYTHLNPRDEPAAGDHYTPLRLLGQGGNSSDYTRLGPRDANPVAGRDGAYTALMPVGLSEGNDEYQDDYIAMGPVRRHNPVYENIVLVATDVVAIVVVVAVLSVYVMKRKRSRRPAENADEHSEGVPLRHQFAPSRPRISSLHSVHNYSDIEDVNVSENTGEHRNPRVASDGYLEPHPRMNSAPTRAQVNSITASGDIGNTDPGEASNYTHLNPRDEPAAGDHYTPLRLLGQGGDSSDYTRLGPREENPVAGSDGAYTALMPVGLSEGNDEYQDDYIAMGPVRRHNPVYENNPYGYLLHLAPDTLTGTIGSDWLCSTQSHNRCLRFDYKMNNEQNTLRVYLTYENSATTKLLLSVTNVAPMWKEVKVPVTATERFKESYDKSYRYTNSLNIANITIIVTWRHICAAASLNCLFVAVDTEGSPAVIRDEPAPTDVNPEQSAPSATLLIVVATAVVAIVVVVAVLSVYVMKRKYSRRPAENADEHSEGAPLRHQFAPSRPWIPSLHSVHNYSDIEDVNLSENTGEHRNPRVASDGYLEPHPLMKSAATCAQVNTTTASGDTGNSDPGEASNYTHLNPRDEAAAGDHYTPLRLLGQGGNSSDYTQLGPREENPVAGSDGAYTALMPVGLSGDREVSGSGGEGNEECQDDYIAMGPARRHNPVYENSA